MSSMASLERDVIGGLERAWAELGPGFRELAVTVKDAVVHLLEEIGRNVLQIIGNDVLQGIGNFFAPLFTGDFVGFMNNLHELSDWLGDNGFYEVTLEVINAGLGFFGFAPLPVRPRGI